jgi:transposase-like protein
VLVQDGEVLDFLLLLGRNKDVAKKFIRKLLKGLQCAPRVIITDKLGLFANRQGIASTATSKQERFGDSMSLRKSTVYFSPFSAQEIILRNHAKKII